MEAWNNLHWTTHPAPFIPYSPAPSISVSTVDGSFTYICVLARHVMLVFEKESVMATPMPRRSFREYVSAILVLLLAVSLPGFVQAQTAPLRISMTDLGTLGGRESTAYGINNKGQVVGSSYLLPDSYAPTAFLWENGTMNPIDDEEDVYGVAFDINDHGQIVGYFMNFDDSHDDAVLWQNGTRIDIVPNGRATGINEQGQIVGSKYSEGAFMWENGTRIDLGTLGGYASGANAINEHGQIVGASRTPESNGYCQVVGQP